MQEAKRYASVNATTLAAHYAKLHDFVTKKALDDVRVGSLDEAGVSPRNDVKGSRREKDTYYDTVRRMPNWHLLPVQGG